MSDAAYGALWFALILAGVIVWFVCDRIRHPRSRCSCQGGRIYSDFSDRWRTCRICKGTGFRTTGKQ